MLTAFSPSLTQCFPSFPHQVSNKCETEQGGVEEKYKQRLSAIPPHPRPGPPIISNSFSYYENKSPYLRIYNSYSVSSVDTQKETRTHTSTLDPRPTPPNVN